MGGGVLPACIKNNTIYFLFGKENEYADTPGWSDFGGGQDGDESFLDAATREGQEEMTGILGKMKPYLSKGYHIVDVPKFKYRTHIFVLPYDDQLVEHFNNMYGFIREKLPAKVIKETKIFEKCEMRWFSVDEMVKKRHSFRSYFREIVDQLSQERDKIKTFLKSKSKRLSRRNNHK
jgi:8-oxo-dGTP pyrophosphatase MutT (NUDIX family)